jgi:hypothetical protein
VPVSASLPILVATGAAADTMSLQRRILASFACHPDPAQETTAIADADGRGPTDAC